MIGGVDLVEDNKGSEEAENKSKELETDLLEAHRIGQRCYRNCSLSLLDSLESIEDWDGFDE